MNVMDSCILALSGFGSRQVFFDEKKKATIGNFYTNGWKKRCHVEETFFFCVPVVYIRFAIFLWNITATVNVRFDSTLRRIHVRMIHQFCSVVIHQAENDFPQGSLAWTFALRANVVSGDHHCGRISRGYVHVGTECV